jgi:hypothetical protein
MSEARALFSPMDERYAFGEMDEVGKTAFAAEGDPVGAAYLST